MGKIYLILCQKVSPVVPPFQPYDLDTLRLRREMYSLGALPSAVPQRYNGIWQSSTVYWTVVWSSIIWRRILHACRSRLQSLTDKKWDSRGTRVYRMSFEAMFTFAGAGTVVATDMIFFSDSRRSVRRFQYSCEMKEHTQIIDIL